MNITCPCCGRIFIEKESAFTHYAQVFCPECFYKIENIVTQESINEIDIKTHLQNKRDFIVEFLKIKDHIILNQTGILYITENDLHDIRHTFDNFSIFTIYKSIIECIVFGFNYPHHKDERTCPWCIVNKHINCDLCFYKIRHGNCEQDTCSKYYKISNELHIQGIQSISSLLRKFPYKFTDLLK